MVQKWEIKLAPAKTQLIEFNYIRKHGSAGNLLHLDPSMAQKLKLARKHYS